MKKINIPIWAIVASFVFGIWPLGVVLIILKVIAEGDIANNLKKKYDYSTAGAPAAEMEPPKRKKREKKRYKAKNKGLFLTLFVIATIISVMASISTLSGAWSLSEFSTTAFVWACSGLLYYLFDRCQKKESNFNKYLNVIGDREAINLSRLSLIVNQNHKKIMQDMQRLIDEGYFGADAYLDVSTNNFLEDPTAKPDAPGEYYFGYEATQKKSNKNASENTEDTIDNGEFTDYLRKLRQADEAIEDRDVSEKVFSLEKVATNIFTYVEDHPEKRPEIRKFVNYYLPTTLKLLESYSRIEKAGVTGKNMQTAKENIESTLDKLVKGFEEQLDLLYQTEAMDISSDIDVLEQMMKQDGLSGNQNGFGSATAGKKRDK